LLHIANSIFETGPAWATWKFPMKRLCGMLIPLVHSRQNPYTNLTKQVTTWTRFALELPAVINYNLYDILVAILRHIGCNITTC
ncbi:hypothetical protein C2G38_1971194, partial [Gigaspora rosea]